MKSRSFGFCFGLSVWMIAYSASCQIVIAPNTQIKGLNSALITFTGDFTNNSNEADFSKTYFHLVGTDQDLTNGTTGSATTLGGLIVGMKDSTHNGIINFNGGDWEIADSLVFNDGIVIPQSTKIIYTIPNGNLGKVVVNKNNT